MSATPRQHIVLAAGGTGIVTSSLDGFLAVCGSKTQFGGVISATVFHDKSSQKWFVGAILISKQVIILELSQAGSSWSWTETAKHEMPKRLSSICFAETPFCVVVADAMGDVFQLPVQGNLKVREEDGEEKHLLLGHFSLLTDVSVVKDRIATCDRDNKIRVSRFPDAHVIDNFLLGHSAFVTCLCWVSDTKLLSGGGDGTVRLWDVESGNASVVHVSEKSGSDKIVVTSLEICPRHSELVVAVVHDDPGAHSLRFLQLANDGTLRFLPLASKPVTGACFDGDGTLWLSVDGEEALSGYAVEEQDDTFALGQCSSSNLIQNGENTIAPENDKEDGTGSEIVRSNWLVQLRKKPIVENWKGKKRKSADC